MKFKTLLNHQFEQHKLKGKQICQEMIQAIKNLGFSETEIDRIPDYEKAEFSLIKDPYTLEENLAGYWYDQNQHRIGNIQFLSDGSFYAEFDIIKPHPTRKKWFVEAVSAWGKGGHIKTEPKLLPALR